MTEGGTLAGGPLRVGEMFAGVGGFRVGLEAANADLGREAFSVRWANQWEPDGRDSRQFAWRCYEARYGRGSCVCEDIGRVLDAMEAGDVPVPALDMLVGGFPCQAFSVIRARSASLGLGDVPGGKGLLWWQVDRMVRLARPSVCLLENVDRIANSPAAARGRDFATILSCLRRAGFLVEWHMVRASDYGMPQKRRRAFILCLSPEAAAAAYGPDAADPAWVADNGVMARAFPVTERPGTRRELRIGDDPAEVFAGWPEGGRSPFSDVGVMAPDGRCVTLRADACYDGPRVTLGDVLVPASEVDERWYVRDSEWPAWLAAKGGSSVPRTAADGHEYVYSQGSMACPDRLDLPARTIVASDGCGRSPGRTRHVIATGRDEADRRHRVLVPEELEAIQCFPRGWTDVGMTATQRGFCMGNALVTDVPRRIGVALAEALGAGVAAAAGEGGE